MRYLWLLVRNAFSETWEWVINSPGQAFVVAVLSVLIGWGIKMNIEGEAAMRADVREYLLSVTVPVSLTFVLVLCAHLLFLSPKRLYQAEKERADALHERIQEEENAPRFFEQGAAMLYGQMTADDIPLIEGLRINLRHTGKNPADEIAGRIWLIDQRFHKPDFKNTLTENVNEVGNANPFNMTLGFYPPLRAIDYWPRFIVCTLHYRDAKTKRVYKQVWYFKWPQAFGEGNVGSILPSFGGISLAEKTKVLDYVRANRPELLEYLPDQP